MKEHPRCDRQDGQHVSAVSEADFQERGRQEAEQDQPGGQRGHSQVSGHSHHDSSAIRGLEPIIDERRPGFVRWEAVSPAWTWPFWVDS